MPRPRLADPRRYYIVVTARAGKDDDLIDFLDGLLPYTRSTIVKAIIKDHLRDRNPLQKLVSPHGEHTGDFEDAI